MKVPAVILADVDYEAAVSDELSARNRFLPPPLASWALRGNVEELAGRLETRMRSGFEPSPHDSVLARKAGRGSRPLAYMALEDRFVYRALVKVVERRLPDLGGRGDYDAFVKSPLDVDGCEYVLKADVAAFYQYVDHERLIDEVVAQTGDDLAITAVVELLEAGSGRRFGLPQMQAPSDVLADTYVDPIRRSLVRKGHRVFRYADDFRVPCANYSEALESLELIERAAYELGLVLNEAKTSSPRRSTYEQSLSELQDAETQLFARLAVEGMTIEDFFASVGGRYGEDDELGDEVGDDIELPALPGVGHDEADPPEDPPEEVEPTSEQIAVATRVVDMWESEELSRFAWSGSVWSALLRKSLLTLESAQDSIALNSAISLLVREPHLTPQVCSYLIALGRENPDEVHDLLNELCSSDIVSVWQSLWVAYLAGSVPGTRVKQAHVDWLRRQVDGPHHAVTAQAALALARRGLLTIDVGARAYERAHVAHRPTAGLALAAVQGAAGIEFVANDQVEGWLADFAGTQRWGRPQPRRRLVSQGPAQP